MAKTAVPDVAAPAQKDRLSTDWHGPLVGDAIPIAVNSQSLPQAVTTAWRIFLRSGRTRSIIATEGNLRPPGLALLALLLAASGRRRLIVMGFVPGDKYGVSGRLVDLVYRFALGRACLGVQVMTAHEKDAYATKYRLPRSIIRHIPFYYMDDRVEIVPVAPELRHGILASGRNSCDWETLLDAAQGQGWPLTIVCPAADRAAIIDRATRENIRVLCDIPRAEHNQKLAEAQLYLVVVKDRGASSGHVRLASAAVRLTPTVATTIPGMSGYERLAVTTVPAERPEVLRDEVNALFRDSDRRTAEAAKVFAYAKERPFSRYRAEVKQFVQDCESRWPPEPDTPRQ